MTRPQNVRWASLDAWHAPGMPRRISAQEARIVACLEQRGPSMGGDWTRREIASAIGMETATVSARVNALVASGIVAECGRRPDTVTRKSVAALALTGAGWQ